MNFFKSKKPPRCFERNIEEMVEEEKQLFQNEFDGVPMNLEISVSVLEKQDFKQGLFRISGNANIIKQWMAKCDSNEIKKSHVESLKKELEKEVKTTEGQYAIAGFMKKYLLTLPNPVINFQMFPKFVSICEMEDNDKRINTLRECVNELSTIRKKTVKRLLGLFKKISLEAEKNQMHAENLATAVGPSILRNRDMSTMAGFQSLKNAQFCFTTMILNYEYIFQDVGSSESPTDNVEVEHQMDEIIQSPKVPKTPLKSKESQKDLKIYLDMQKDAETSSEMSKVNSKPKPPKPGKKKGPPKIGGPTLVTSTQNLDEIKMVDKTAIQETHSTNEETHQEPQKGVFFKKLFGKNQDNYHSDWPNPDAEIGAPSNFSHDDHADIDSTGSVVYKGKNEHLERSVKALSRPLPPPKQNVKIPKVEVELDEEERKSQVNTPVDLPHEEEEEFESPSRSPPKTPRQMEEQEDSNDILSRLKNQFAQKKHEEEDEEEEEYHEDEVHEEEKQDGYKPDPEIEKPKSSQNQRPSYMMDELKNKMEAPKNKPRPPSQYEKPKLISRLSDADEEEEEIFVEKKPPTPQNLMMDELKNRFPVGSDVKLNEQNSKPKRPIPSSTPPPLKEDNEKMVKKPQRKDTATSVTLGQKPFSIDTWNENVDFKKPLEKRKSQNMMNELKNKLPKDENKTELKRPKPPTNTSSLDKPQNSDVKLPRPPSFSSRNSSSSTPKRPLPKDTEPPSPQIKPFREPGTPIKPPKPTFEIETKPNAPRRTSPKEEPPSPKQVPKVPRKDNSLNHFEDHTINSSLPLDLRSSLSSKKPHPPSVEKSKPLPPKGEKVTKPPPPKGEKSKPPPPKGEKVKLPPKGNKVKPPPPKGEKMKPPPPKGERPSKPNGPKKPKPTSEEVK
eukprot:gene8178-6_t